MNHYRLYGLHIITDFNFLQLVKESPDISNPDNTIMIFEGHFPEEYKSSELSYQFIDENNAFFINSYCYMFFENGNKITYEKRDGIHDDLLNSYFLGFGISILGFQRGLLSLHCACLADEDGAIIISGSSGSGKSTITTALLDKGLRLVADDMVLVDVLSEDKAYAYPAFPYTKLCRDAAINHGYNLDELIYIDEDKDKFLVPYRGTFSTEKVPVKAIIMLTLTNKDELFKEEIPGLRKMYACMDTLFIPDIIKQNKYGAQIGNMCVKLASKVPIYHVSRPIFKDTTNEMLNTVLDFINLQN